MPESFSVLSLEDETTLDAASISSKRTPQNAFSLNDGCKIWRLGYVNLGGRGLLLIMGTWTVLNGLNI